MDLSNYASELLKLHGELKVPGLGYFVHKRKSSYYDKETGSLYPPYYETSFDPHLSEDDDNLLISYFSEKKHISMASSKYFLDKYIEKVKLQAETDDVDFADLGTFYIDEQARLAFRANRLEVTYNSSLYGYAPVSIQKLADYGQPVKPRQVISQPVYVPKTVKEMLAENGPQVVTYSKNTPAPSAYAAAGTPVANTEEEELAPFSDEEEDYGGLGVRSNLKYWISIAVFVIAAIAGSIYYYKNYIQPAQKEAVEKKTVTHVSSTPPPPVAKPDSTKKADTVATGQSLSSAPIQITDSLGRANQQKTQAQAQPVTNQPAASTPVAAAKPLVTPLVTTAPQSAVPKNTWLVVGGTYGNINSANRTLTRYHNQGYPQARLLDAAPSLFFYKIIFSYHATKEEADTARTALLKAGKLKPKYITVQPNK